MITKVVSGGQTGADKGSLDGARAAGIETGGFAPKGWRTETGRNQSLKNYGLVEHSSSKYPPRTLANIVHSDGTVIFDNF